MATEMTDQEAIERRMLDRRELIFLREEVSALGKEAKSVSAKIGSISGTLKVMVGFIIASITIALWVIQDTRNQVQTIDLMTHQQNSLVTNQARIHEMSAIKQSAAIISVLNIVSINQKRVMKELDLPYFAPQVVKGLDD